MLKVKSVAAATTAPASISLVMPMTDTPKFGGLQPNIRNRASDEMLVKTPAELSMPTAATAALGCTALQQEACSAGANSLVVSECVCLSAGHHVGLCCCWVPTKQLLLFFMLHKPSRAVLELYGLAASEVHVRASDKMSPPNLPLAIDTYCAGRAASTS